MQTSRLCCGALALLLLFSAGPALARSPVPAAAPSSTRVHLARPGTDIEADTLVGNLNAETYTVRGNVVIHSDPKVDRAVAVTESSEPFTLSADAVDVERKALRYAAKGNVHFVQGARDGRADTALLDEKSHDLDLVGHAHVADGGQQANADRMHYNTLDKHFTGVGNIKLIAPVPTPTPGPANTATPAPKKHGLKLPF
ncbi:MAG: hypothetical protein NVSMB5_21380 [Candidatus Velthaea sp.]